ncbi:rCG64308 [Rattus norvegicus]|uniref:RCG64308 n=1 Tax=Rattus norvegicus TaxID=10116 RepID=A6IJ52_RAT|nr:rCG64308 [Rattus norvegicus]
MTQHRVGWDSWHLFFFFKQRKKQLSRNCYFQ